MKDTIYRIFVLIFFAASILIIAVLFFLPDMKAAAERNAENVRSMLEERNARLAAIESMNGLDFLAFMTEQEREKNGIIKIEDFGIAHYEDLRETNESAAVSDAGTNESFDGLRMELPQNVTIDDITLVHDYIDHRVDLTIARANDEYLIDYPMIGESEKIKDLSFANTSSGFVMQFSFDCAMECLLTCDSENEKYVYVDFARPKDLYDNIVVIDAGHGATTVGAVAEDHTEKEINLDVVLYLKELFDKAAAEENGSNLRVFYTRLEDIDVPLSDRSALANELEADLMISIHCNSYSKQESVRGTQVLYDASENIDSKISSEWLSQLLLKNTTAALQTKDMGVIDGSDKYILRTADVPATILEIGFMTNNTDLSKMIDPEYQKKCAQAVYDTINTALEEINK